MVLGIVKPTDHGSTNAWGALVNNAFDTVIAAINSYYAANTGLGGQLLRRKGSGDGAYVWDDNLHRFQHLPGQPDDTLTHGGRLSSTAISTLDIEACPNAVAAGNQILYLVHRQSHASFTATRMGASQRSTTAPTGQTLARFGLYTYDPLATDFAYNLVASTASDNTLGTATSSQNQTAIQSRPLTVNYSVQAGQQLALAFLSVNTTGPQWSASSTNAAYSDNTGQFGPMIARQLPGQADLPQQIAPGAAFAATITPFLLGLAQ